MYANVVKHNVSTPVDTYMTTSFFIRPHKSGSASIYLRINEGRGFQYRLNTGYQINKESSWNSRQQKVRVNSIEHYDLINLQLGKLKSYIESQVVRAKTNKTTRTPEFYKSLITEFKSLENNRKRQSLNNTLGGSFKEFIRDAKSLPIGYGGKTLKEKTIIDFNTTLQLICYFKMDSTELYDIDMNWYYTFISKSEKGGKNQVPLSLNYIGKNVKNIKRVLRYAEEKGKNVNQAFKSRGFQVRQETSSEIYLNEEELSQIRQLRLDETQYAIDLTRDLFMIGAYSGLRVSDYNRLSKQHIKHQYGFDMIEINCQKTNSVVVVPIHPVIKDIMEKYYGTLPPYQNEQLMNKNLKVIGKMTGINELVSISKTQGGKLKTYTKPKYEMIKTHTARRSFCTNAYLSGMDSLDIMALSGHKTEKNFLKYIKVTRHQRAKRIAEHKFFQ